jgi:hypothetical protein
VDKAWKVQRASSDSQETDWIDQKAAIRYRGYLLSTQLPQPIIRFTVMADDNYRKVTFAREATRPKK